MYYVFRMSGQKAYYKTLPEARAAAYERIMSHPDGQTSEIRIFNAADDKEIGKIMMMFGKVHYGDLRSKAITPIDENGEFIKNRKIIKSDWLPGMEPKLWWNGWPFASIGQARLAAIEYSKDWKRPCVTKITLDKDGTDALETLILDKDGHNYATHNGGETCYRVNKNGRLGNRVYYSRWHDD